MFTSKLNFSVRDYVYLFICFSLYCDYPQSAHEWKPSVGGCYLYYGPHWHLDYRQAIFTFATVFSKATPMAFIIGRTVIFG